MSDEVKINLTRIGLLLAAAVATATLFSGWVGLPEKVSNLEHRAAALEERLTKQEGVLIRIDENVKSLKEHEQRMP
jgi:hypothetical protein